MYKWRCLINVYEVIHKCLLLNTEQQNTLTGNTQRSAVRLSFINDWVCLLLIYRQIATKLDQWRMQQLLNNYSVQPSSSSTIALLNDLLAAPFSTNCSVGRIKDWNDILFCGKYLLLKQLVAQSLFVSGLILLVNEEYIAEKTGKCNEIWFVNLSVQELAFSRKAYTNLGSL